MSAVAAMPVAVRLPRSVAARRVLLTAFFLGGFLGLALLFGGSAHAASVASGSPLADGKTSARETTHTVGDTTSTAHKTVGRHHSRAPAARKVNSRTDSGSTENGSTDSGGTHKAGTPEAVAHKAPRRAVGSVDPGASASPTEHETHGTRHAAPPVGSAVDGTAGRADRTADRAHHTADRADQTADRTTGRADRTADRTADRAGLGEDDWDLPVSSLSRPPDVGGLVGHAADSPGGTGGAHDRDGTGPDSGGNGSYGPDASGTHHGSPSGDPEQSPTDSLDHPATAIADSHQNDGGAAPDQPLHGTPAVPAAGSGVAQSAAHGGGGPGGGPDQLAGYVSDMERFGLPSPGAVAADRGAPTRDRPGDILEFPG